MSFSQEDSERSASDMFEEARLEFQRLCTKPKYRFPSKNPVEKIVEKEDDSR
jgi:hypothetical protein